MKCSKRIVEKLSYEVMKVPNLFVNHQETFLKSKTCALWGSALPPTIPSPQPRTSACGLSIPVGSKYSG